ncbi:MAG: endonuclease/exonuclease/phosphatase family protein [Rhodospirillaceae bacterium]|nr:endonuclease/exonuclease/phosphatase family protein [Rhodospirillaceae bacterium]
MIRMPGPHQMYRLIPDDDSVRILGQANRKSLGRRFTLVSWNMHKARKRAWLDDLTLLCEDADFVLLQEAVLHGDRPHAFHLESGFEWVMGQNFAHRLRGGRTSGVKTGSRIASISHQVLRSADHEPFIRLPKTILATAYNLKAPDETLLLLNIHAVNFVSAIKFSRQIEQLKFVIEQHRGSVILAGDFNTWNPRRRKILFRAVAQFELHRVPVAAPLWRHLGQVLDHVFYRGVVLKKAWAVLNVKSSDHIPLKVEFERWVPAP